MKKNLAHTAVAQDFDRVCKKQKTMYTKTKDNIDKLLSDLGKCLQRLEEKPAEGKKIIPPKSDNFSFSLWCCGLEQSGTEVKAAVVALHESVKKLEPRKAIEGEQKAYHKALAALSKTIDKVQVWKIV